MNPRTVNRSSGPGPGVPTWLVDLVEILASRTKRNPFGSRFRLRRRSFVIKKHISRMKLLVALEKAEFMINYSPLARPEWHFEVVSTALFAGKIT